MAFSRLDGLGLVGQPRLNVAQVLLSTVAAWNGMGLTAPASIHM